MSVRTVMMAMMCLACSAALASAEEVAPQVMVAGSATLQKQPTELRVSLTVVGEGKDLAEALAKLAKTRDDAKGKLAALKPVQDSLKASDATMADVATLGMNAQQRQYQMIMQMRGGAKPPAKAAVTASATLTASFPLPAATGDEALVKAHELEKQIRAAVAPAAGGEARKLTPEEQELAEEMAGMDQPAGAKPGEPSFLYVLSVSDAEAAQVTADALAKAQKQATLLAEAAGMKLGAIRTLRSDVNGAAAAYDPTGVSEIFRAAMGVATDQSREATSPTPGPVSYGVTVNAGYELAKK